MECTRPINIVNKNRTCLYQIFVLLDTEKAVEKKYRLPLAFKRRGFNLVHLQPTICFLNFNIYLYLFVGLLSRFC